MPRVPLNVTLELMSSRSPGRQRYESGIFLAFHDSCNMTDFGCLNDIRAKGGWTRQCDDRNDFHHCNGDWHFVVVGHEGLEPRMTFARAVRRPSTPRPHPTHPRSTTLRALPPWTSLLCPQSLTCLVQSPFAHDVRLTMPPTPSTQLPSRSDHEGRLRHHTH